MATAMVREMETEVAAVVDTAAEETEVVAVA